MCFCFSCACWRMMKLTKDKLISFTCRIWFDWLVQSIDDSLNLICTNKTFPFNWFQFIYIWSPFRHSSHTSKSRKTIRQISTGNNSCANWVSARRPCEQSSLLRWEYWRVQKWRENKNNGKKRMENKQTKYHSCFLMLFYHDSSFVWRENDRTWTEHSKYTFVQLRRWGHNMQAFFIVRFLHNDFQRWLRCGIYFYFPKSVIIFMNVSFRVSFRKSFSCRCLSFQLSETGRLLIFVRFNFLSPSRSFSRC